MIYSCKKRSIELINALKMFRIRDPESDACDSLERGEIDVDWVIQMFKVQGFKCSRSDGGC